MLYGILLLFVLWFNRDNSKAIALLSIIGATVLFPYESITNYYAWYAMVIIAECLIIFSAWYVKFEFSPAIYIISGFLIIAHITNYFQYSPHTYKSTAVFLEYLHLITFIITSNTVMTIIKRKLQWMLRHLHG